MRTWTEVQKVAKDFVNNYIADDMTDFEKEMEIIQYMVQNITYDYDNFLEGTVPGTSYGTTGALYTAQRYAPVIQIRLRFSRMPADLRRWK